MLVLYCIVGLIIYNFIVLIIGKINFNNNIKKKILIVSSIIYNFFFGYIDTYFALLLYGYFSNMSKGSGYEVSESEAGYNVLLGIITLIIYLILLIPINFYIKKKGKINFKVFVIINFFATLLGFIIFWIFLDKSKRLF